MNKIIGLGASCEVGFILDALKLTDYRGKTGIFDCVSSIKFSDIISLVQNKFQDIDAEERQTSTHINSYGKELNIGYSCCHIKGTDICTQHYKLENYKEIIKRRSTRFFEDIKNPDNNIFFIRKDIYGFSTTFQELKDFEKLILEINPNLKYQILVIHTLEKDEEFVKFSEENGNEKIHNEYTLDKYHPKDYRWDLFLEETNLYITPILEKYLKIGYHHFFDMIYEKMSKNGANTHILE